jgi:hypothetical protein
MKFTNADLKRRAYDDRARDDFGRFPVFQAHVDARCHKCGTGLNRRRI